MQAFKFLVLYRQEERKILRKYGKKIKDLFLDSTGSPLTSFTLEKQ
jgi:hypothetical protein